MVCHKINGRNRVICGGWDKTLMLFDDDPVKKEIHPAASYRGHQADITALAVADNTNLMASGDYNGVILVWNTVSWAVRKKLMPDNQSPIIDIHFASAE